MASSDCGSMLKLLMTGCGPKRLLKARKAKALRSISVRNAASMCCLSV